VKLLFALCLSLGLSASAEAGATKAKTAPAPLPPPYAGVYQPQGVDEIGLWRKADEYEREL